MTEHNSGPPGEPGPDLPGPDLPGPELDPGEQRLASLLADLADDPDAPPSTVTVDSVLAEVRARAPATGIAGPVRALDVSVTAGSAGSDGSVVHGSVMDGGHRFHGRRRAVLVGVLAAACLTAVAAVVIPLSLRSSDTTTSAEPELVNPAAGAAVAGRDGAMPGRSAGDQSAPAASAAGSMLVPPPVAADSGQADAAAPALPATPEAAGGNAASSAACAWTPLSASAAAAVTQSLPPARFGAPGELVAPCAAEPVAGARLPDSTGGSLVVTVATAKPGACASGSSNLDATEAGIRCVSQGSGRYLSTGAGGVQTAYAYGNGLEVAVGKDRSGIGLPEGSQLTADQLQACAQKVLGALG